MAYSMELQRRIEATGLTRDLTAKKMFGGVCWLADGKMAFGIWKDALIVRLGVDAATEALLGSDDVRPFDVTGRPMKGWIMVEPAGWTSEAALRDYLTRGAAFAAALPD